MSTPPPHLMQGIQLVQAGQKAEALAYLRHAARTEEIGVEGWLWLAAATDDLEEYRYCVEMALQLDPYHPIAQRMRDELARQGRPIGPPPSEPGYRAPGQQAFQMATQLAFLTQGALLDELTRRGKFSGPEARSLARIGLANYFAGALVLPYGLFLASAEELRYDIDLLGGRFGVGFETVCHRLSTLQRPRSQGVPFFFVRVDRAGNISKRQSATDFHFSRGGGTCPLWNVYEAFASPGRILTQMARMPDDRTYLWIARTVSHRTGGWGAPGKDFAIGLGCDIRHAHRLIYSQGLDLADPSAATPIGGGCRVCERAACPQRAFPAVGRPLAVDENRSQPEPYAAAMLDS